MGKQTQLASAIRRCLAVAATAMAIMATAATARAAIEPLEEILETSSTLGCAVTGHSHFRAQRARYLAFAKRARIDGQTSAAALFQAAAWSAELRAGYLAKIISRADGEFSETFEEPAVAATEKNLRRAISDSRRLRKVILPAYIKQARDDGERDAVRHFNWWLRVEDGLDARYRDALSNLVEWRGVTIRGEQPCFPACTTCGNIESSVPKEQCPVCGDSPMRYSPPK